MLLYGGIMDKIKVSAFSKFIKILKSCMIGLIFTLLGVVLFAIILKFVDLSSNAISYVNDVIKVISLFIVVFLLKKHSEGKLILNSFFAGIIYALISFGVFSILNGKVDFNLTIVYDLLFAVIVSLIIAIMVNLMSRKS